MGSTQTISEAEAWNAVSLEERLELLSFCHAEGFKAAIIYCLYMGAVTYGFDLIWLFYIGLASALLVGPVYSARKWRREKPLIIMHYLAARTACRRYAFSIGFSHLVPQLIFRAVLHEEFSSKDEEETRVKLRNKELGLDLTSVEPIPVWICLLRGGLVVISEQRGGAKLELHSLINADASCSFIENKQSPEEKLLSFRPAGVHKNRRVSFSSRFPGALYVLERQIARAIYEDNQNRAKDERIRQALAKTVAQQ